MARRRTAEELAWCIGMLRENGFTVISPREEVKEEMSEEGLQTMAIEFLMAWRPDDYTWKRLLGWTGSMNSNRTRIVTRLAHLFCKTTHEQMSSDGGSAYHYYVWEVLVHRRSQDVLELNQVGPAAAHEFFSTLACLGLNMEMPEDHPLIREAKMRLKEKAREGR